MNYDRQGTKQTFIWSHTHIHTYKYIHVHINIHTDGTKRLTLLRIRAQGNNHPYISHGLDFFIEIFYGDVRSFFDKNL